MAITTHGIAIHGIDRAKGPRPVRPSVHRPVASL